MARLARPASELLARYDAIVVGSGYGGGVSASRLARAGLKVAVLERGREFLPGEFPSNLLAAQRETQISVAGKHIGSHSALFDLRMGDDVHAMMGCGLGGTSLINANVCLSPDIHWRCGPTTTSTWGSDAPARCWPPRCFPNHRTL
jgi:cholesterol oxidase